MCRWTLIEFDGTSQRTRKENIFRVALEKFPVPHEDSAWQDINDFKKELRDKQWAFRRFLCTLCTKEQTESEIRDDIAWFLNDYSSAMKLHGMKASLRLHHRLCDSCDRDYRRSRKIQLEQDCQGRAVSRSP